MRKIRLLVVEDDEAIQEMLSYSLQDKGYDFISAYTVKQAWEYLKKEKIDMVLLDWMLPDSSGIDLLRRIRKYYASLPVIMITAKTGEADRVFGLDIGADDYVTKPFSVKELNSRIQAVLRRIVPEEHDIQFGKLLLDPSSHRVLVGNEEIDLSPIEFRLLHFFMTHSDRVFSRAHLLDQVWGEQVFVEERTVDVHIRRLRKQLSPFQLDGLLQTVHGSGYRFSLKK